MGNIDNKTIQKSIRFTPDQVALIDKRAAIQGLDSIPFMRSLIIRGLDIKTKKKKRIKNAN